MLEPPDLPDNAILAAVRTSYGIAVASIAFLPIGCDSSAWAYRVQSAEGASYFLKVRKGITNEAGLIVPRYLSDHGVSGVVAPLPTLAQTSWIDLGDFALILYPFIDGANGRDGGMNAHNWATYGAVLRQVHTVPLAPDLMRQMRRETFTPEWGGMTRRLDAHIAERPFSDPVERELAAFWRARRPEIRALLDRAEHLGGRLRAAALPLVLCHADIHTWNVMVDTADRLWIVDWDETVLAPKERDLMFVVGGIGAGLVRPHEEAWFFAGYGAAEVDPLALAYYRYAWAIGDIGSFGEEVFLMPDVGEPTKRNAVQLLMTLFDPGRIVALAYAADRPGT